MAKEKIGVVGAGLMGAEIALVFALAGHEVVLADTAEDRLAAALARLGTVLDRGIPRGFFKEEDKPLALARIATSVALDRFATCDFVTEAVFEDEGSRPRPTETSTRSAKPPASSPAIPRPFRSPPLHRTSARRAGPNFIGTHYFSPASRMKLVEVIPAFDTAPTTLETAMRLMREADKVPIRVKDVAGFAVNRVLLAFMNEAVRLVDEGVVTAEDLDTACKLGLGHPMGPFELMDATTSKLCLQASEILFEAYGERFRPPALLKQRVRAGFVGGRGQRGWRDRRS